MNANKAVELGFADGVLEGEKTVAEIPAYAFSRKSVQAALMNKISAKAGVARNANVSEKLEWDSSSKRKVEAEDARTEETVEPAGRSVDELKARLETIKNFI